MTKYRHQRGEIKDNALKALLHDPLFHQRIEKSKKGRGSYCRKDKNYRKNWEADSKQIGVIFLLSAFYNWIF